MSYFNRVLSNALDINYIHPHTVARSWLCSCSSCFIDALQRGTEKFGPLNYYDPWPGILVNSCTYQHILFAIWGYTLIAWSPIPTYTRHSKRYSLTAVTERKLSIG